VGFENHNDPGNTEVGDGFQFTERLRSTLSVSAQQSDVVVEFEKYYAMSLWGIKKVRGDSALFKCPFLGIAAPQTCFLEGGVYGAFTFYLAVS